jgi:integrase
MRQGELLKLRWEHIDLNRRTAHLPDTKNGESRTVPLSETAVSTLRSLPRSITGDVFPNYTRNAVKKAFVRARERAGIEDLRFHDLRHEAEPKIWRRNCPS